MVSSNRNSIKAGETNVKSFNMLLRRDMNLGGLFLIHGYALIKSQCDDILGFLVLTSCCN